MEHTCNDCRNAQRLNMEQIARFMKSGKNPEDFLNDPYEEEMSAHMLILMRRHSLRLQADTRFPSPR